LACANATLPVLSTITVARWLMNLAGCTKPNLAVTSSIGSASRSCAIFFELFQALCDQVESRLMPTTTVSGRQHGSSD
jgi:hypothetical protein